MFFFYPLNPGVSRQKFLSASPSLCHYSLGARGALTLEAIMSLLCFLAISGDLSAADSYPEPTPGGLKKSSFPPPLLIPPPPRCMIVIADHFSPSHINHPLHKKRLTSVSTVSSTLPQWILECPLFSSFSLMFPPGVSVSCRPFSAQTCVFRPPSTNPQSFLLPAVPEDNRPLGRFA